MRIQKLLAQAGVASRRAAEDLITGGHVRINGKAVTDVSAQIDPEEDRVEVDGRRIKAEAPQYRVLLKPRACLATLQRTVDQDGRARPTIARFVSDKDVGWKVVAPLDFPSEGVLLLTTDGDFAEKMGKGPGLLPMTYHVKFQGSVGEAEVARLLQGWRFEQRPVKPTIIVPIATTGKNTWIELVVREARVKAIHAAGELIRRRVLKVSRVKLGDFSFEGLGMGGHRDLNKKEVAVLRKAAGLG